MFFYRGNVKVFVFITLIVSFAFTNSTARTWYINPGGTGDAPTIQAGIDSAVAGDTVSLANGTYNGVGNRDIDFNGKAITVRSESGNPDLCVIDCEYDGAGPHRGFHFHSLEDSTSALKWITIANAFLGGILCESASPTIIANVIRDNFAMSGGGIQSNGGSPNIVGNLIIGNNASAYGMGGGILCSQGSPVITNNTIANNYGGFYGGGIRCNGGNPKISENIISGNSTGVVEFFTSGGGISCAGGSPTITNNTIVNNSAWSCDIPGGGGCFGSGGGIHIDSGQNFSIVATIVAFNRGGGVHIENSSGFIITCCDVDGSYDGDDWQGEAAGQGTLNGNFSSNPFFCDPENGDFALSTLSDCLPRNNTCGVLIGGWGPGCDEPVGIEGRDESVSRLLLKQNRPNPFNPQTTIEYSLPQAGSVRVSIYDVRGQMVTVLVNETQSSGEYQAVWDGFDSRGVRASSGVYFVRLEFSGRIQTRKMVMLK